MTTTQIMTLINAQVKTAIELTSDEIAQKIEDKLKENLQKKWYSRYSPLDYDRTYDLLNSIESNSKQRGMTTSIEVKFNVSDITPNFTDTGWNSHMSFTGSPFTSGLIESIENGMGGSRHNPRRGQSAHMIRDTQKWADTTAIDKFTNTLGKLLKNL